MANKTNVDFVLNADTKGFNSSIQSAGASISSFVAKGAALIGGTSILTNLGKSAIQLGLDFEQGFAKVSTLFGDVAVDTDNLKTKILDLSTETGIASTELNEGLYSALSAGIPVTEDMSDAMDFLTKATQLSVAGFTSTEKAVDVATTVLNSYGLEVGETDRVMNTLIETQNAGVKLRNTGNKLLFAV